MPPAPHILLLHSSESRNAGAAKDITIPRWQHLDLELHDPRHPHDYQDEALDAWAEADHRGSIVLPTGSGETFVAT